MKKIKHEDLKKIITAVFPDSDIPDSILNLQLGDLEEWDSQGHLNLLLYIEEIYNIRFTMNQMTEVKSIKQIIEALESHLN
jgi:acyl carrier protein